MIRPHTRHKGLFSGVYPRSRWHQKMKLKAMIRKSPSSHSKTTDRTSIGGFCSFSCESIIGTGSRRSGCAPGEKSTPDGDGVPPSISQTVHWRCRMPWLASLVCRPSPRERPPAGGIDPRQWLYAVWWDFGVVSPVFLFFPFSSPWRSPPRIRIRDRKTAGDGQLHQRKKSGANYVSNTPRLSIRRLVSGVPSS